MSSEKSGKILKAKKSKGFKVKENNFNKKGLLRKYSKRKKR